MAIFNEILEGQLNQILVKRLGMKGGAPSPALNPEIWPGLVLESDRPEWKFLASERQFGSSFLETGTAGQLTVGGISNPGTSGCLVVIERLAFEVNTTSRVEVSLATSLPTGAVNTKAAIIRDGRQRTGTSTFGGSVCLVRTGAQAVGTLVAGGVHVFAHPAGQMSPWFESPIILPPGVCLIWETDTNQVQTRHSIQWRERRGIPDELVGGT